MACELNKRTRKSEINWTEDSIRRLIGAVEEEPILWDSSLSEYKNKTKRESAWAYISEIFFDSILPSAELNRKWQNLRCQFKDHCNKAQKKKSGQGTDENYIIRWKYYDSMKFLLAAEVSGTTETSSNMENVSKCLHIQPYFNKKNFICIDWRRSYRRHATAEITSGKILQTPEDCFQKALTNLGQFQDDAQIFSDFVASSIREIPKKSKQQELKRALNRTLLDFQETEAQTQSLNIGDSVVEYVILQKQK